VKTIIIICKNTMEYSEYLEAVLREKGSTSTYAEEPGDVRIAGDRYLYGLDIVSGMNRRGSNFRGSYPFLFKDEKGHIEVVFHGKYGFISESRAFNLDLIVNAALRDCNQDPVRILEIIRVANRISSQSHAEWTSYDPTHSSDSIRYAIQAGAGIPKKS